MSSAAARRACLTGLLHRVQAEGGGRVSRRGRGQMRKGLVSGTCQHRHARSHTVQQLHSAAAASMKEKGSAIAC